MFQEIKQSFALSKIRHWLIQYTSFVLAVDKEKADEIIDALWKYSCAQNAPLPIEYFQQYGEDLLRPFVYILSLNWHGWGGSENIIANLFAKGIKVGNLEQYFKFQTEGLHKDFLELIFRLYLARGIYEKIALLETQSHDCYGRWISFRIIRAYLYRIYKEKQNNPKNLSTDEKIAIDRIFNRAKTFSYSCINDLMRSEMESQINGLIYDYNEFMRDPNIYPYKFV